MTETHYVQRRFDSENSQEEAELLQIYNDHFKRHNITFDQFMNTRLYPNSAATIAILNVVFAEQPAPDVFNEARQERGDEV